MEVFIGKVIESKKILGSFSFRKEEMMKIRIDDLYQYNIWLELDREDMDQLREKGVISIDTNLENLELPFIHIIATKELKDELDKE